MRRLVVAIDGPAGAGKSTREPRARAAARLHATSTPARCIASSASSRAERGIALDDDAALAASRRRAVASSCATAATALRRRRARRVGGDPRADAGELASRVSTRPVVRERLVALQRALGAAGGVVMDGRDIGTVVFPDAPVKFFLTADAGGAGAAARGGARAHAARRSTRRRWRATSRRAIAGTAERAHAPLRPAADARIVDTTRSRRSTRSRRAHCAERGAGARESALQALPENGRYGVPVAPRPQISAHRGYAA